MNDYERPTHLDLFSGIGGFAIAAGWAGFRTVGFCEIESFCQRLLKKRFPHIPCIPEIRSLDGTRYRGVTLITGGFPCQPYSLAGRRRGTEDHRNLWPEMRRVIEEARPAWVLGENVIGILDMELDSVLSDLEALGYATRTFIIPACAVDAKHKRERIFILANTDSHSCPRAERGIPTKANRVAPGNGSQHSASKQPCRTGAKEWCESLMGHAFTADAAGQRLQGVWAGGDKEPCPHERPPLSLRDGGNGAVWETEPDVGRVVDGVLTRLDAARLQALGNAIVPQCAYPILKGIYDLTCRTTAAS